MEDTKSDIPPSHAPMALTHGGFANVSEMNRVAIRLLLIEREAGATAEQLYRRYDKLRLEIEATFPGWGARPARCVDGSFLFIGEGAGAFCLVITPEREIAVGHIYPGGLIDPCLGMFQDREWLFPKPNFTAPKVRLY